ncbi:DNA primase [Streptomyces sp. VRA16 Mangrove soil]|uniref:DNA primase n=1 Tax=Streptomyces sp. VRA16 Mangrove soil TaxID=2817434 RepID=UPI001A9F9665|nr:DNA primase [Streptomyces sp. VRA16 Mangrove soil]MBO1330259.1 DNA primase [Streptomyces sp. VRA16 Mangrove soil]
MNRAALGLAVGAGYLLGRTKKMKLAFAVGTMVAGKKLQLSPSAALDLVRTRLADHPQFKELGGQLRQDLRGVGKAATGAILERQMESLADRLQAGTAGVRDRLDGVTPNSGDAKETAETAETVEAARTADTAEKTSGGKDSARPAARRRAPAKKTAPRSGERGAAPRKRTQGVAKKTPGSTRRAPSGDAKGERGDG